MQYQIWHGEEENHTKIFIKKKKRKEKEWSQNSSFVQNWEIKLIRKLNGISTSKWCDSKLTEKCRDGSMLKKKEKKEKERRLVTVREESSNTEVKQKRKRE